MADTQLLKDMIKLHVKGDVDGASTAFHNYLADKMREISAPQTQQAPASSAATE